MLSVFGAYVLVSCLLFIFPVCKVKNRIVIPHIDSNIILGAHRGGSLERLENSLPAFQHARETGKPFGLTAVGMHLLEMDVQLTKDKLVVVHHDPSLERLTGVDRKVSEFNYDELPRCKEEVKMHFGFETYSLKPGIDDGRIPLLRDVFRENPNIAINIDLKGGSDELMHEVYKLIIEFQREEITYFGDMNETRNMRAQRMGADAGVRTFASIKYTILICLAYFC